MDVPFLTDSDLLRRHLAGETDAFRRLVDRHRPMVHGVCRRTLGETNAAEDATQAVFLLLNTKAKALVERDTLGGWLHSAARLTCRNLQRDEARRARRELQAMPPDPGPEPSWSELSPVIDEAMGGLKSNDQEVLLLRFGQDLSLAEVGGALGINENTARMRVDRALERLRKRLAKFGVTVTLVALGNLMTRQFASAGTIPYVPITEASTAAVSLAAGVARQMVIALAGRITVGVAALALMGAGGYQVYQGSRPKELTAAEARRLLDSSVGEWTGELVYADDRDGSEHRYRTIVNVRSAPEGTHLTARYIGSSATDETDIKPSPDGTYEIVNGGEAKSHVLDGNYRLIRQPDGTTVFEGFSRVLRAQVRMTFSRKGDQLILGEDYRREMFGPFQFRNRMTLTSTSSLGSP